MFALRAAAQPFVVDSSNLKPPPAERTRHRKSQRPQASMLGSSPLAMHPLQRFGRRFACSIQHSAAAPKTFVASAIGRQGASKLESELLLENHRLRILKCTLAAGVAAHVEHAVPTARWRVLDRTHATPAPIFCRAGEAIHLDNTRGGQPMKEVVFQILQQPQRTSAELQAWESTRRWSGDLGTDMMLENEYCKLWDFRMLSHGGSPYDFHQHMLNYAVVFLHRGTFWICTRHRATLAVASPTAWSLRRWKPAGSTLRLRAMKRTE
eukprot:TRINITY_DN64945_c0_g1_i1.p1 TRINITY_DN64945_c0_g1~~TRINITY_DN64945_c0_g1_i1.p1  ORF type:complete len:266 (-),score=11.57 TRINITY_DN64945_c0_g1_i1:240-1037(-)